MWLEMTKYKILDSGLREEYTSGMVRDTQVGKPDFSLLIPEGLPFEEQLLTRWAALMTRGIEKYGYRNWEKANSVEELNRFKASAYRHLIQYLTGEDDEDNVSAVLFNLNAAEYVKYKLKNEG